MLKKALSILLIVGVVGVVSSGCNKEEMPAEETGTTATTADEGAK